MDANRTPGRAGRELALLTAGGLLCQGLGFVYRVMLSRLAQPRHLGLFHLVMPLFSLLTALCLSGLSVGALRLTARFQALERPGALRRLMALLRRRFARRLLAVALLLPPGAALLARLSPQLGPGGRVLLLLWPLLLGVGLENIHKNYFHGLGRVGPPVLSEVLEQGLRIICVGGLLTALRPATGVGTLAAILLGMVLCQLQSALLMTVWAGRDLRRRGRGGELPAQRALQEELAAIARPVTLTNGLGALTGSLSGWMLVNRLVHGGLSRREALARIGILNSRAVPLAFLPGALLGPLQILLVPRLCAAEALEDREATGRRIGRALSALSAGLLPCAAGLWVLGKELLEKLYGSGEGAAYLPALGVLLVLSGYRTLLGAALGAVGGQRQAAAGHLTAGAVQLAVSWILTGLPGVGLLGDLWAECAASLGCGLYFAAALRERCGPGACRLGAGRPLAAAVTAGLWCRFLARRLGPGAGLLGLAAVYALVLKLPGRKPVGEGGCQAEEKTSGPCLCRRGSI